MLARRQPNMHIHLQFCDSRQRALDKCLVNTSAGRAGGVSSQHGRPTSLSYLRLSYAYVFHFKLLLQFNNYITFALKYVIIFAVLINVSYIMLKKAFGICIFGTTICCRGHGFISRTGQDACFYR